MRLQKREFGMLIVLLLLTSTAIGQIDTEKIKAKEKWLPTPPKNEMPKEKPIRPELIKQTNPDTVRVIPVPTFNMTPTIPLDPRYPQMILVEGGTFTMGDEWMLGAADEQPTHEVTLNNYKIGKTEVTVLQYRTFCESTGRSMPEEPDWGWQDDHPIANVSWYDAVAYCDWLSEKKGGLFRLPTDAEWEYAARGGNKSVGYKYSGGQIVNSVSWFEDNSGGKTHAVATKKANELGIHDMSGNVEEWCADKYLSDYYSNSPTANPRGPSSGIGRVTRGGSWYYSEWHCRVANRSKTAPGYYPTYPNNSRRVLAIYGFRVVLSQ